MVRFAIFGLALGTAVTAAVPRSSDLQPALHQLLVHDLRFSDNDISDLEHGKVVRHTLPATSQGEVAAVGGIRIRAPRERFAAAYRDIVRFKRGENVLQIGRFSTPPELSDLDSLKTTRDDFDLRECRVRDCDIRLPAGEIQRIQREIDWRAPDADARAAVLFKQILVDHVRAYEAGGPGRITQYDDDEEPKLPMEDFQAVLKSSPYVDAAYPGLGAHLASYPENRLAGAEDFLYWSKEKFGFAPFISVTHVTLVEAPHEHVATTRDVYSSRYFDASLALVIASDSVSDPQAFYLFYVNRSRASALRGAFSALRRSIVERRVRGSLEQNLRVVKQRLELNSN